jgi:transcriptional regulator with XRE-family HTH domain
MIMKYSELKELCEKKNISIGDLCLKIGYTYAGFRKAVNEGTIQLKAIRIICSELNISPLMWFDTITEVEAEFSEFERVKLQLQNKQTEITLLREKIADKDEIIALLRSSRNGYGNIAAEPH